jgi:hypothetical protein
MAEAMKTLHLTDPEMFALSHVTAFHPSRSHRKVIGTAYHQIRFQEFLTKRIRLTDLDN